MSSMRNNYNEYVIDKRCTFLQLKCILSFSDLNVMKDNKLHVSLVTYSLSFPLLQNLKFNGEQNSSEEKTNTNKGYKY
jgi:hypothetical protein